MKIRIELVFKIKHNSYSMDRYYFGKYKKAININEVDTAKIANKTPYGKKGKYGK